MNQAKNTSIQLGIAGIGGYGQEIAELVLNSGKKIDPSVELAAVCDPKVSSQPDRAKLLDSKGVALYDSYEAMLRHPGLEAVWLPVPIDLHLSFAKQALGEGLAVMLEKPVAGTIDEVDELIAARDAADRPLLVGFQNIYAADTLPLKRRLLSGQLGAVRRATVHGCWPRDCAYFSRAAWAGAMRRGNTWVLDSPVNNAMAHFINLAAYLLGEDENTSATPTHLEAELYRAAEIENYDTASIRVRFDRAEPIDLLILLTHATATQVDAVVEIETDRGGIRWNGRETKISRDGEVSVVPNDTEIRQRMLKTFARQARGQFDSDFPASTLESARVHTTIVNAASQAALITPIPRDYITRVPTDAGIVHSIPNIETVFAHCASNGRMLHESGKFAFTTPAVTIDLRGYSHFAGPA
ncbi:MAG: Gfo/Idh/MocA family oxidoreductase [Planctomycetota bacterium]